VLIKKEFNEHHYRPKNFTPQEKDFLTPSFFSIISPITHLAISNVVKMQLPGQTSLQACFILLKLTKATELTFMSTTWH